MGHETPNPPHDPADWEALARYFAGESTPEEAKVVRGWLEAHPDEAAALNALGGATSELVSSNAAGPRCRGCARQRHAAPPRDVGTGADVIPIDSRRPGRRTPRTPVVTTVPARRWQRFAGAAAAAAVLLIGGRTGVALRSRTMGIRLHRAPRRRRSRPPSASAIQFDSPMERVSCSRPRVGSSVAAGYGDNVREVDLEGEAYFDVRHDEARPFLVRAAAPPSAISGRRSPFARPAGQGVRVAVTSGSVSLAPVQAPESAAVVLQPGDAGTLGTDGRTLVERGGAAEPDTAWTRGRLVFREAPSAACARSCVAGTASTSRSIRRSRRAT